MLRLFYDPYLNCSKSLAFLLLFLCFPLFGEDTPQAGTQINIPASALWTDTGIALSAGQRVTISASGTWSFGLGEEFGPDGDPHFFNGYFDEFEFFDLVDHGRLLGFVGPDPYQGQWGNGSFFPRTSGYISVGSGQTFKASAAGELWLGMNDDAVGKGIGDNSGQLTATISIATIDITAPVIKIKTPSTVYAPNQNVLANYSCTDLDDAVMSCAGTVANGTAVDTSSTGPHAFTVVAQDSHGNYSSKTLTYMVATVGLTPLSIPFKPQKVGTASTAHNVKLVNQQNVTLNISSIGTSGDFQKAATTCASTLPAHKSCSISVKFVPSVTGTRSGQLNVSDDAGGQSTLLIGVGK